MSYFSPQFRNPRMEHFEREIHKVLPHHFARFLEGEPLNMFEQVSDHMHLHLYIWAPTPHRNMWTIVTAGMSAHRMNTPPELSYYSRAELVFTLPATWPSIEDIERMPPSRAADYRWPIEEITAVARLPYLYNTWLARGHTVRNGYAVDDTYAGSNFSGVLLDGVTSLPPEAQFMEVNGTPVHFLGLYPLYPRELHKIVRRHLTGHDWFHRCLDAGFHEGLLTDRPLLC